MTKTEEMKEDPLLSFKFGVEIGGLLEGFFMECTGLQAEREIEEYKEGGQNSFVHKFPGRLKYPNVVLKRGITSSTELWSWYEQGKEKGTVTCKDVFIILYDPKGEPLKRWNLSEAFPVKWSGPELKADSTNVAVETLELAHHGLTLGPGEKKS